MEHIGAFFLGPERLLKIQYFEKKGNLSSKIDIVAFFIS